jgi:hypothetical protein
MPILQAPSPSTLYLTGHWAGQADAYPTGLFSSALYLTAHLAGQAGCLSYGALPIHPLPYYPTTSNLCLDIELTNHRSNGARLR